MKRAPPRSPLFPYPTLFRSGIVRDEHVDVFGESRMGRVHGDGPTADHQVLCLHVGERSKKIADVLTELHDVRSVTHAPKLARDRKSTRLNSSHANISYAVFC